MNHLLPYNNYLFEYYDTFYSRKKAYNDARELAHRQSSKYFTNLFKNITPDELKIIQWYRDCGYRQIVEYIFSRKPSYNAKKFDWRKDTLEKKMLKFEKILDKSVAKKDVVVWKGLSNSPIKQNNLRDIISKLNVGDSYTFKNFFSTSLNFQYSVFAFSFIEDIKIVLKINVPAGKKAAYISHDKIENEVVLQRDQTIKLKNVYEYDLGGHFKSHKSTIIKIYEFDLI